MRRARHLHSWSAVGRPSRGFSRNTPTDPLLYMYIQYISYLCEETPRSHVWITLPPKPLGAAMSREVPHETLILPLRDVCMLAYVNKIEQENVRVELQCFPCLKPNLTFSIATTFFSGPIRRYAYDNRGGA